jgi:nitroreductase
MKLSTETKKLEAGSTVDVLEAIRGRRAVRHYQAKPVPEALLKTLLEFAVQAPSAVNSQPWRFVVIQDSGLLKEISDGAKKTLALDARWKSEADDRSNRFLDPAFDIFYGAPALVIVCAAKEGLVPEADCYLACQNLMLAAYGLGLGTCPVGLAWDILRIPAMKQRLAIPEGHFPVLPIIVGYPAGEAIHPTPRNPPEILSWFKER